MAVHSARRVRVVALAVLGLLACLLPASGGEVDSAGRLVRESGVQGYRGQMKKAHFEQRSDAENSLMRLRDNQLKRGYRVVFREGSPRDGQD